MENQFAAGRSRIHLLLQSTKTNTTTVETTHNLDQMRQRAAQPVQSPDNEGVAGTQVIQSLSKPWPGRFSTAGYVRVKPRTARFPQSIFLQI